jgi:uncharacterized Zn finger protein
MPSACTSPWPTKSCSPTDQRAYARAVRVLKQARTAAQAADRTDAFDAHIAGLRDQHRRRPTLIAMLDKAGLGGP